MVIAQVPFFFAQYSQDIQEIFLLESLYALTILLMEVSSGYLADHFGMVVELRLGGVFWPAAWLLWLAGYCWCHSRAASMIGKAVLAFDLA